MTGPAGEVDVFALAERCAAGERPPELLEISAKALARWYQRRGNEPLERSYRLPRKEKKFALTAQWRNLRRAWDLFDVDKFHTSERTRAKYFAARVKNFQTNRLPRWRRHGGPPPSPGEDREALLDAALYTAWAARPTARLPTSGTHYFNMGWPSPNLQERLGGANKIEHVCALDV